MNNFAHFSIKVVLNGIPLSDHYHIIVMHHKKSFWLYILPMQNKHFQYIYRNVHLTVGFVINSHWLLGHISLRAFVLMKTLSWLTGGWFHKYIYIYILFWRFLSRKPSQTAQCIVISVVLFLLSCSISWKSLSDGLKQLEWTPERTTN